MIRRTQQRAAEPAAGDVREISLERFSLRHLHRVEIVARVCKGAALENAAIGCNRAGFALLMQRRILRRRQANIVALGFFQEETREREHRISD